MARVTSHSSSKETARLVVEDIRGDDGLAERKEVREAIEGVLGPVESIRWMSGNYHRSVFKVTFPISQSNTPTPNITCPVCKITSHNPNDVLHHYCGNCKLFHDGTGGVCAVHEAMGWGRILTGERAICTRCLEKPGEVMVALARQIVELKASDG